MPTVSPARLRQSLADIFGFSAFRPHQEEIVTSVMSGRDVFAIMPTGGGKSLCYQLPAALAPGVAVVVSPLISLMKDQVDAANANGIGAASLNSSLGETEKKSIYLSIRQGEVKLLYISPERFNAPGFIEYLKSLDISFFAVDEAHCVSEWGHDFRPDYLSLAQIAVNFPDAPIAAFTATATTRVGEDIVERLKLRKPYRVRASFNRPNLVYHVRPKESLDDQLLDFIRERGDEAGIIYRTTRKNVEATASLLKRHKVDARAYHAGLPDAERSSTQEDFRHDRCQVVVATIAFGMGIDKPNVRFVVHADLPKNIEGYYQETGRAGRDGEPARCLLLHSPADAVQLVRFNQTIVDAQARATSEAQLRAMLSYARADGCRRTALLAYFGEEYPEPDCGGCDVCLGEVEREDATVSAQKALSAMVRTGNRFGAGYITDVLTGAATAKIRQNGHDKLPTYGVGKDMPKSYWRAVVEGMIGKGLAELGDSEYPVPRITEAGWRVLRGEEHFEMLKQHKSGGGGTGGRTRRSRAEREQLPFSRGLFAVLRQERSRLASEKGVPPYVIFPDAALQDMGRIFPRNEDEMLTVTGVGKHKFAQYGEDFLRLVADYLREHPEEEPERRPSTPAAPTPAPSAEKPPPRLKAADTLEFLAEGLSVEEVAERRGVQPGTVIGDMEKLAQAGHRFDPDLFFTPARLARIHRLFAESGGTMLKPVVEASGGDVTYIEARLARLFL